jgi:aspartate kinase
MFDAFAAEGINIEMISTSPIRVSCVVHAADGERAARAIHDRFGLSGEVREGER